MQNVPRPLPFVLASSNHGTMILNRNDYHMTGENSGYGVGYQILSSSCFDPSEVDFALALIAKRLNYFGPGVMALDCGANIGVHTIEWGRFMYSWGNVLSFEAQEKIFYALAGNIAINNCLNVSARHCAIGSTMGHIDIPEPDYCVPSSYGSFELRKKATTENIGQAIDYSVTKPVNMITIDSLKLSRLDFIKIDIEGMEVEALTGAEASIKKHKPIIMIEIIKSDQNAIKDFLSKNDYTVFPAGINLIAIHASDPTVKNLSLDNVTLQLS